ncbi:hypothetical protein [Corynebacterium amycolatum]|uniref:hypothetical protein n=1 Tax=Corynebacterium amycolatum TaxID=43765 RepID=UPI00191EBE07|nr:hypothetical protein [Corynebacterium amycolatum]QQU97763.1 hypothetical protein I6I65_10600 [Corynebacterium amycolatum]
MVFQILTVLFAGATGVFAAGWANEKQKFRETDEILTFLLHLVLAQQRPDEVTSFEGAEGADDVS